MSAVREAFRMFATGFLRFFPASPAVNPFEHLMLTSVLCQQRSFKGPVAPRISYRPD